MVSIPQPWRHPPRKSSPKARGPGSRTRGLWAATGLLSALGAWGCGSSDSSSSAAASKPDTAATGKGITAGGTVNTGASSAAADTPNATGFAAQDKLAIPGLTALPLVGCVPSDYYGQINIGGTEFALLIDSGSTTTAVAGSNCSSCSAQNPTYNVTGATSAGGTASASYGDNSGWSGSIFRDLMGAQLESTLLTPHVPVNFVSMSTTKDFFTNSICSGSNSASNAYQGILGLGPDLLLESGTTSLMAAVAASGSLKHDAYAVQLCDMGGRMWFGGYDPEFISGEPLYAPIMPYTRNTPATAYYSINMLDLQVNGATLGVAASAIGATVVDTGTSSFLLKPNAFSALAAKIGGNAAYMANFPASMITQGTCSTAAQNLTPAQVDAALPTVGMTFANADGSGNFTLTLPATQSYLIAIDQPDGTYAYCSVVNSSSLPIMGGAVLRGHVVVFDRDELRVGFVPQASCSSDLPQVSVR